MRDPQTVCISFNVEQAKSQPSKSDHIKKSRKRTQAAVVEVPPKKQKGANKENLLAAKAEVNSYIKKHSNYLLI